MRGLLRALDRRQGLGGVVRDVTLRVGSFLDAQISHTPIRGVLR